MFEEPSSSPIILTTSNFPKGGDFMEQDNPARQAAIEAAKREAWERIQGLRESEVPYPAGYDSYIQSGQAGYDSYIQSGQGRVIDERQDPTHPLRKGRIKPDALEIAEVIDETGQQGINPVDFKSVSRMDAGE